MEAVLVDEKERNYRIYEIPKSAIMQDGKKLKYFDFILSLENEDCNRALKRIVPNINMSDMQNIVETTPYLSDLQVCFFTTILHERKEKILDHSLELLLARERTLVSQTIGRQKKHRDER